jgi:hypothetical protein
LFSVTGLIIANRRIWLLRLRALLGVAHQWKAWLPRAEDVLPIRN